MLRFAAAKADSILPPGNAFFARIDDPRSHLLGADARAAGGNVFRAMSLVENRVHGRLDRSRFLLQAERVPQKHGGARIVASGLAMPLPAMSGAEPWMGS